MFTQNSQLNQLISVTIMISLINLVINSFPNWNTRIVRQLKILLFFLYNNIQL